ncbi:MAG: type I secretion system permease/ATPase [Neptuniibacter sp.]
MQSEKKTDLQKVLHNTKGAFITVGFFSMFINFLMIVPAMYMLQIYDRVITGGSESTLLMLTLIMVMLLVSMGGLEFARSRMLVRISARIDQQLAEKVYNASFKQALYTGGQNNNAQPIKDLTGLRQFLTGSGPFAFFDAPWIPVYIAVMFMFHPWYGWVGVFSALLLSVLAIINEKITSKDIQEANHLASKANDSVRKTLENSEVIESMGMQETLRSRWKAKQDNVLILQATASDRSGTITSISKTLRMVLQSSILGLGAYLVLEQQITPGLMIGGSIILGRALAPIDQMIGAWKGFVAARSQYARLDEVLQKIPQDGEKMSLPAPTGFVSVEGVSVAPPGARTPVLKGISFEARPGEIWGILGPSAAGKSTLARALLGVWPVAVGKVRLDKADVFTWNRHELGEYIGYLPQDIELFDGTVSENIARFGDIDPDKIVAAAKSASVHEMILSFPDGYDTQIGAHGGSLSGGQRQRIGLARAIYGSPVLVILDEPNSNLDDVGERALSATLQHLKEKGTTVFLITHRSAALNQVDKLLVLANGQLQMQGSRDEVLTKMKQLQASVAQKIQQKKS